MAAVLCALTAITLIANGKADLTQLTCQQALEMARTTGVDRLDAHLLLLHALSKTESDRAWLLAHDGDTLEQSVATTFRALTLRRAAGEPLAYIVGYKEFFGLTLTVDSRVLVPRPDTETLVEWSLEVLRLQTTPATLDIADLGTGSGAVALAIAHSLKAQARLAQIVAVDASRDALDVARANAKELALEVRFVQSHWLEAVSGNFHLIASNPPYVAAGDPHLAALVHEPLEALAAGADGFDDIRQIVRQAPDSLHSGGWLLLEHGYDQADAVCQLLAREGFRQVQSRFDLAGIARCTGGQWSG